MQELLAQAFVTNLMRKPRQRVLRKWLASIYCPRWAVVGSCDLYRDAVHLALRCNFELDNSL
jgi:hypothetical protein